MALIWITPIPFTIGPFLGSGKYVYNPEVFYCEHSETIRGKRGILPIVTLTVPFLYIVFLNVSVYKTARRQIYDMEVHVRGHHDGAEGLQQQERISRRLTDRKAAVDVAIIISAFLVCLLIVRITALCRQGIDVPAEAVHVTTCIYFLSTICNPIIYSIRKREFRKAVKKNIQKGWSLSWF